MIGENQGDTKNTEGDSLAGLLSRMSTAIDSMKEVDIIPEVSTEIVEEPTHSNHWYKGMRSPNPSGRPSRKPLTDALMAVLPPDELARIIADYAKKGKDWAVRLAAMYTQAPETLNRIGGEDVGEPIKIQQLAKQAQEMGIDINAVIQEGEKALREAWDSDVVQTADGPMTVYPYTIIGNVESDSTLTSTQNDTEKAPRDTTKSAELPS